MALKVEVGKRYRTNHGDHTILCVHQMPDGRCIMVNEQEFTAAWIRDDGYSLDDEWYAVEEWRPEPMTVYVVTCEQSYANHFYVVGVFATRDLADAVCVGKPDYRIEDYEVREA